MPEMAWDIGYQDQAVWLMYERSPDGSITVLDHGEIDPNEQRNCVRAANDLHLAQARQADIDAGKRPMADWWYNPHDFQYNSYFETAEEEPMDFKVGDVVRVVGGVLQGVEAAVIGIHETNAPFVVNVSTGPVGTCCKPSELELVSRPSEAKPKFKAGDRVLADGEPGTIEGPHDSVGHWVRMDNDTQPGNVYWLDDSITPMPTPPALKVGDRVRILMSGGPAWDGKEDTIVGTALDLCGTPRTGYKLDKAPGLFVAPELELLPPEPAKPIPNESLHPGYLRALERSESGMTREQAIARGVKVEDGKLVKSDGWMPAGTYMPTMMGPKMTSQEQELARQLINRTMLRLARMPGEDRLSGEVLGAGLRKLIPACERRYSSRTLSWSNMGDEYDLLEDA